MEESERFGASVDVLSNQGFNNSGYLPLLTARKLGGFLENQTHLAGWSGTALLSIRSDKFFNHDAEDFSQLLKLIRAQSNRMPFPPGVSGMLHAQTIGNLLLRQPGDLSQSM